MGSEYRAELIRLAKEQESYPYLFSDAGVRDLRNRLARELDELWRSR